MTSELWCREVLLEGLKRLEYRGYDSAGVAIFNAGSIKVCRCEGKIVCLEDLLQEVEFILSGHMSQPSAGSL